MINETEPLIAQRKYPPRRTTPPPPPLRSLPSLPNAGDVRLTLLSPSHAPRTNTIPHPANVKIGELPPHTTVFLTTSQHPASTLASSLFLPALPSFTTSTRLRTTSQGTTLSGPSLAATVCTRQRIVLAVLPDATLQRLRLTHTTPLAVLCELATTPLAAFLRAVDAASVALDVLEDRALRGRAVQNDVWEVRRRVARLRRHGLGLRGTLRGIGELSESEECVSMTETAAREVTTALDTLSLVRESAHAALELLLAAQNNRMQETMQTLAVVTTMFVPLTFLAGIEGMNFANQPELRWGWSYAAFWIIVVVLIILQLVFFRRKGWI